MRRPEPSDLRVVRVAEPSDLRLMQTPHLLLLRIVSGLKLRRRRAGGRGHLAEL